jgi:hypothetical protein
MTKPTTYDNNERDRKLMAAIILSRILEDGIQTLPAMIDLAINATDKLMEELEKQPPQKKRP